MVGRLPDARDAGRLGFGRTGDEIALVGAFVPSLAASELAKLHGEPLPDALLEIDIAAAAHTFAAVREAVRAGGLSSAHDIAEGGLAVALAESCLAGGLGASVELAGGEAPPSEVLFGEAPGGFVVSGPPEEIGALSGRAPVQRIGKVGGEGLTIEVADGAGEGSLALTLEELSRSYSEGLTAFFA
jgi:phosphoribosylformylglycinamidine synthase